MNEEIHNSPLISIIMPTYNRASLIMETIESIRSQTYKNWELIILDDGSEDNTEGLVENLADNRISFIKAGRIGIGGKLKNAGIARAKGDLLAFMDSDDLWDETKLEKQVDVLLRYPGCGFCLTGGYTFRQPGVPLHYFYQQRSGLRAGNIFEALFNAEITNYVQALLLRKECLQVSGPFTEDMTFSDTAFIISLAEHYDAVILYEPLFFRRLHDSNYIHTTWERSCIDGISIINANKRKLPRSLFANAMYKACVQLGEKYLRTNRRRDALLYFGKAWQQRPFNFIAWRKLGKGMLYWLRIK